MRTFSVTKSRSCDKASTLMVRLFWCKGAGCRVESSCRTECYMDPCATHSSISYYTSSTFSQANSASNFHPYPQKVTPPYCHSFLSTFSCFGHLALTLVHTSSCIHSMYYHCSRFLAFSTSFCFPHLTPPSSFPLVCSQVEHVH